MADLITSTEIVLTAFDGRTIDTAKIPAGMINAIQVKHIRPVLGKDFYNAVIADTVTYATLITYIKPAIAYFIKFYILPNIFREITNTGVNQIPGQNRNPGTLDDLGSARQAALDNANLFIDVLVQFIKDNLINYPLYYSPRANDIKFAGGMIITPNDDELEEDFYLDEED